MKQMYFKTGRVLAYSSVHITPYFQNSDKYGTFGSCEGNFLLLIELTNQFFLGTYLDASAI